MGIRKKVDDRVVGKVDIGARPKNVSIAVWLLYFVSIVGIVIMFLNTSSLKEFFIPVSFYASFFAGDFFSFAILFFLAYMIGMGKNWARIMFLVLFLIGIVPSILSLLFWFIGLTTTIFDPKGYPVSIFIIFITIFVTIKMLFQAIALILLFRPLSSDWFKK